LRRNPDGLTVHGTALGGLRKSAEQKAGDQDDAVEPMDQGCLCTKTRDVLARVRGTTGPTYRKSHRTEKVNT
jgi:hypothetical protein